MNSELPEGFAAWVLSPNCECLDKRCQCRGQCEAPADSKVKFTPITQAWRMCHLCAVNAIDFDGALAWFSDIAHKRGKKHET